MRPEPGRHRHPNPFSARYPGKFRGNECIVGRVRCIRHDLLDADVVHGRSLIVAEFNRDGLLDIYCGETAKWTESRAQPDNPEAHMWLGINSGRRTYRRTLIAQGFGAHETRAADLNGDGRLDLICKPYDWRTPRVELWPNKP